MSNKYTNDDLRSIVMAAQKKEFSLVEKCRAMAAERPSYAGIKVRSSATWRYLSDAPGHRSLKERSLTGAAVLQLRIIKENVDRIKHLCELMEHDETENERDIRELVVALDLGEPDTD